jgi:hypothetical protein
MQGVLLHSSERQEFLPELKPLDGFPRDLGPGGSFRTLPLSRRFAIFYEPTT